MPVHSGLRKIALGLTVVVGLNACTAHVDFAAPAVRLTPYQRVAMFNALRGVAETTVTTTTCRGTGGCARYTTKHMALANGAVVDAPEDLLPLLPSDSEAAQHVRAAASAGDHALWWSVGTLLVASVGGLAYVYESESATTSVETRRISGGVTILAVLVGGLASFHARSISLDETSLAFHYYNEGLAKRLAICVAGLAVVPCEGTPAPAGPGAR